MLGIVAGIVLIVSSVVLRYLGYRTIIALCGEHWETLFGRPPYDTGKSLQLGPPLFPNSTPADFDALIVRDPAVLRGLPSEIMKAGMRRVGLRNWAQALFWIGAALLIGGLAMGI